MKIYPVTFKGMPDNYRQIDNIVSRSAQPQKEDFFWLKQQGVTDIVNFRTMAEPNINFDEQTVVENLGIKYHNIPSHTRHPEEKNILEFLKIIDNTEKSGGKVHIHCKAGADRTGMYSFIYKSLKKLGTTKDNIQEWLNLGHNSKLYPDLIPWTKKFIQTFK